MSEIDKLWSYFKGKPGTLTEVMYHDLCGVLNWTDDMRKKPAHTAQTFYGLYKGLYLMKFKAEDVHDALLDNRLHDFIVESYGKRTSGYLNEYLEFRKNGWKFYDLSDPESDSDTESK